MTTLRTALIIAAGAPRMATFGLLSRIGEGAVLAAPPGPDGGLTGDDVVNILRTELPKAVGEKMAEEREKTLEKVAKLDEKLTKLDADFQRVYAHGVADPKAGKDGLVERGLVMRPHESVDDFVERHGVTSGRIFGGQGAARATPAGRGAGLAGVRDQRGITAARMIRAFAAAERSGNGFSFERAAMHAKKQWGDQLVADRIKETEELATKARGNGEDAEIAQRSLGTMLVGSGAGFVKPDFASFFMDYLFAQSIVRSLGAMSISIKSELEVPFVDTAVSASFRGEATGPNAGQPGEGRVTFVRKILGGIVAVTNEWLNESDYSPDVFIRNHLSRALAVHFDLKALRGRGASSEIRGADYWVENAGTAHYFDRAVDGGTGLATFKTTNADLLKLMQAVSDENIDLTSGRPGYGLPNREFYGLMRVLAGTALESRPFADELRGGTLNGAPALVTTQIPLTQAGAANGSGTNNKSNIYFGEWSTFAIGEAGGLEIKAMDGAAYKDSTGTTQPGFTNNETVIRADQRLDTVALQRGKELARLDSTDIGVAF